MRRVIVNEFLSLDGVMQAPGDADEDRRGGFEHGGWQMPYFDDVAGRAVSEGMAESGGFLLGRRTYEIFAAFWPSQPDDDPFAATLNSLPKYVASTTLEEPLEWENSTPEFRLMVHPIVLGSGRRLFRDGSATTALRLVDTKKSTTGVLILTYQPAGTDGTETGVTA